MGEKQPCRHQGQCRRRGRRCLKCRSRDPSLATRDEDHGEAGCPPAAHGGPQWSRSPRAARGRDPTPEQVDAWRKLWPRGEPALEQVCWQGLWPCGGPTLEQPVPDGLYPMGGTCAGAVCEELQPVGRTHIEELCGELSSIRDTSHCSRGRVWGVLPLRDKERQRQHVMNWPQPPFPVHLHRSGEGGREMGVKLSRGRREGWGEGVLRSGFIFLLSCSDLIGDELNSLFSPSSVCFVRDSNWWVNSPRPYLDPRAFHHFSSALSIWGTGVIEQFWWAPGIYPG